MAILMAEALKNNKMKITPMIFATDISDQAIKNSHSGVFKKEALVDTKLGILDNYFVTNGNRYEVIPEIRKMVHFSIDDVTSNKRTAPSESIFGTFDLILCRNVRIYFSEDVQTKILNKLFAALETDGILILGTSESLTKDMSNKLEAIDDRNRIYKKITGRI